MKKREKDLKKKIMKKAERVKRKNKETKLM